MKTSKSLIAAAFLCVTSYAHAQQCSMLQYNGAPFTTVTSQNQAGYPISSPLVGTVTLPAALPTNGTQTVTPASWNFSTESAGLVSTNISPFNSSTFSFTTVNGQITEWSINVNLSNGDGNNPYQLSLISTESGDSINIFASQNGAPNGPTNITGSSSTSGTWTCIQTFNTAYTAPPDPPPVNPLTAQVAQLQAELTTTSQQLTAMTQQMNVYKTNYLNLGTTVTRLNAIIDQDNAWNAEWIPYYKWQAAGWEARANSLSAQLSNLEAQLKVCKK